MNILYHYHPTHAWRERPIAPCILFFRDIFNIIHLTSNNPTPTFHPLYGGRGGIVFQKKPDPLFPRTSKRDNFPILYFRFFGSRTSPEVQPKNDNFLRCFSLQETKFMLRNRCGNFVFWTDGFRRYVCYVYVFYARFK